ncbi:PLP-dependent aminotransferase family protein [Paucilactobacillus suebicus]|uniref:GntR family transcriptional regulator n=1 Tax=Paucilactobacillus suebicus DSM 5007 = KCTC 3549 TaxID=1423807 RepID=A0A0R1VZK0_9LACO|nr:PLP-dependent aminotransferase family protein [Paucilactobacillus suebicus]KRM10751.1 GntR family transcriptional regulator [Paucilactobacillus suebicus DSM 5007 = KCTC 3549]
MQWQLPSGKQAAYLKLISLISQSIENGDLLPGDHLPPERELSLQLGINRSTIQHAFNELVSRGILVRKVGSGTWVNSGKWGVLSQGVNWQSYMTTGRLGDPENFMIRLRNLEHEKDVINLAHSSIDTDLSLPVDLTDMTARDLVTQEASTAISGALDLKHQLSKHLSPFLHQSIPASQILITSGAQQAFYLITQGLLSYGDAIAIEEPSYFYQLSLFQAAGIRVFGIPLKENGGLDLDVLEQLYYKHHLRFLFVNPTGQNPTTETMPLKDRQELIERCQQLNLPIVEDDPLGLTNAIMNDQVTTLKQLDPSNVLYIGSFSSLSGESTRIGWLIAPPAIVNRLAEIRQQMEAGISIFPQLVSSQLLKQNNLTELVDRQMRLLKKSKQRLLTALKPLVDRELVDYRLPTHSNNIWLSLNSNQKFTSSDYNTFLDEKLLVRPDFLFGVHVNHVRISFTQIKAAQVEELQARMERVVLKMLK